MTCLLRGYRAATKSDGYEPTEGARVMPNKKTTWICVVDAGHLRILRSSGPGTPVERVTEESHARDRAKDFADRPGRSFESADGSRHGLESESPARRDKRDVAAELGKRLSAHAERNDFDRLILVAPPKFMGDLRPHLSDAASSRVIAELDKDLTRKTDAEIRDKLADLAPV